ncbi:SDR family oxidoreductase [Aerophototrophica crusticola]|uniref:SDR family oxidoreductase n=1 Tax=Aerophototrophica crusticola TaxID=1709002 RepID=A0A858R820_9PROT|nr:SDR family oxidoreductase [Rhodospirillaceae bacterium B3]
MSAGTVLVTGGSGGVGAAVCRQAAAAGWKVWVGYGNGADRAESLAVEINRVGGWASALHVPLADPDGIREAAIALAADEPADAVVLCAAAPPDVAPFFKQTPEQLRVQFEVNVVGNQVLLAELWRRCFRPRGGGHVLGVLTAALGPPAAPHMAGYVAAKGGLAALLEAAKAELGPAGLRVDSVSPGYIETPMLEAFPALFIDRARAAAPGGRFLTPEEVAGMVMEKLGSRAP